MSPFFSKRLFICLGLLLVGIANWEHFFDLFLWCKKLFFKPQPRIIREVPVYELELNCGVRHKCPENSFPIFLSTASSIDNQPRLCVADKYVIKPQGKYEGRGLNGAIIDSNTFKVISVRNFDTYLYDNSVEISEWIDGILDDDILVIFTSDEASSKMLQETRNLLNSLGSGKVQNLQYRSQWYMITQKKPIGFTIYEKITYSKRLIWGETIEFRGCIPKTIPKRAITVDDPLKQNKKKTQFCEERTQEDYKGFCNEPRFEIIMPALVTNKSLMRNEIYSTPIFIIASKNLEVFISCLDNMIHQPGVAVSLITVLYDDENDEIPSIAKIFGVHCNRTKTVDTFGARLKQARDISTVLYPKKNYLIVLDAEVIPSPDFLFFLSQMLPVFENDTSVFCVSGWSCNCYNHSGSPQVAYRVLGSPQYGALISAKPRRYEFYGEIFTPDVSRLQGPEACHLPTLEPNNLIDRPQDLTKERYYHKLVMLQQLGHVLKEEDILNSCSSSVVENEVNLVYVHLKDKILPKILQCLGILNNQYGEYHDIIRLSVEGKAVLIITSDSGFYKSRPIASVLELSKNDTKTSTQIGLPYYPARMSTNEKKPLRKTPNLRVEPAYRVDTVYTPLSGYRTTYGETYKILVRDDFVINSKMLKQPNEYLKSMVTRPLSLATTEYRREYPTKTSSPCAQGISIEKLTTAPMVLTGRDEREHLPLTQNYGKYLDIYLTTSRLAHRTFTLEEQRTLAAKNIVTFHETMGIPKGRGFGCKFPEFAGQDLDNRDPNMIDHLKFKTKAKLRFIPNAGTKVPNFGSESVTQASYKRPKGIAVGELSAKFAEIPHVSTSISAAQSLCPPGMYTTEISAINSHTSPQAVV